MEFFILGFIIGGVLALAVSSIIHESAEGTRFGQELEAMRRASNWDQEHPSSDGWKAVGKDSSGANIYRRIRMTPDVRIVFRHVPTDDGGSDLL